MEGILTQTTEASPRMEVIDIGPHPRLLSVLGDIEFALWQCLAELVDNAFDDFLVASRRRGDANRRHHLAGTWQLTWTRKCGSRITGGGWTLTASTVPCVPAGAETSATDGWAVRHGV